MGWRKPVLVGIGLALTGCFGLLAPEPRDGGVDGGLPSPDGGSLADGGPAPPEDAGVPLTEPDGGPRAPLPACSASTSKCIQSSVAGVWVGAAVVTCDGIPVVGPVTLLLEEEINGHFQPIDHQTLVAPGLGATFTELNAPPVGIVYEVCIVDSLGTRCGPPLPTESPPECACEPLGCDFYLSCNTTVDDGCGGKITCGPCTNGNACNPTYDSCCGAGLEPDGDGKCVCAPPTPCINGMFWNVVTCACEFVGG